MGKHRQTKSLGNLNNYVSGETPLNPEPETVYERVKKLERRVAMLEGLLNDVMIQIDTPKRDQNLNGVKASKPKLATKPVEKKNKPEATITIDPDPEVEACKSAILEYLSDGGTKKRGSITSNFRKGTYSTKLKKKALGQLRESRQISVEKRGNAYLVTISNKPSK